MISTRITIAMILVKIFLSAGLRANAASNAEMVSGCTLLATTVHVPVFEGLRVKAVGVRIP